MSTPIVSVIMPAFNAEKYIREAIDSILNQTFTDFEFIIINDGSTDKTEEIILSYQDSRIVYAKNDKNIKLVPSLNRAVQMAKGKYIARMDADDISIKERFSIQLLAIEASGADILGCAAKHFGKVKLSSVIKMPESLREIKYSMLNFCPIIHPTILAKADVLKANPYPEEYLNYAEDLALWANLIIKGYKILNIPDVCLLYRYSPTQWTVLRAGKHRELAYRIRDDYAVKVYGILKNEYGDFLKRLENGNISIKELNFWIAWFIRIGRQQNIEQTWIDLSVRQLLRQNTSKYSFLVNILTNYKKYISLMEVYYLLRVRISQLIRGDLFKRSTL